MDPLPWTNQDGINLTFRNELTVYQSDHSLAGVSAPPCSASSGSFDPSSCTASRKPSQPTATNRLLIDLSDSVEYHLDGFLEVFSLQKNHRGMCEATVKSNGSSVVNGCTQTKNILCVNELSNRFTCKSNQVLRFF
jgi:hypothetical protein